MLFKLLLVDPDETPIGYGNAYNEPIIAIVTTIISVILTAILTIILFSILNKSKDFAKWIKPTAIIIALCIIISLILMCYFVIKAY